MTKKEKAIEIFKILEKEIPNPVSELEYTNPYTFLVAVVLSAQSTDKGVNKATKALFEFVDTPQKMVALGIDKLKDYIKTIGLYNNKAKNIIALSQDLVEKYNGIVPHNREALENLAGVGRKTANVVLNVIWDEPVIAVDTHVIRISNRLDFSTSQNPLKIEEDLNKLLPNDYKKIANHLLVLFGRYTCKAQKPDCENCPIAHLCQSTDKRI
ncbi:MAG: endonuclease III [Alphaproteobacteria bacterium]|nr:endonuclease III [Alphaproteobacteria bacterium]